ncbi:hypothetical protein EB118_12965 [bacterium]|nr:hypothetical protein [Actinomycetota bacterium]NDG30968.1 hypothetical protein [bacterium]
MNRNAVFNIHSKNVRNNIIETIKVNYPRESFTHPLCQHMREFKRNCLDRFNEITIELPSITFVFKTSLVDGKSLVYEIPSFDSKVHPDFQKIRWWEVFKQV